MTTHRTHLLVRSLAVTATAIATISLPRSVRAATFLDPNGVCMAAFECPSMSEQNALCQELGQGQGALDDCGTAEGNDRCPDGWIGWDCWG